MMVYYYRWNFVTYAATPTYLIGNMVFQRSVVIGSGLL